LRKSKKDFEKRNFIDRACLTDQENEAFTRNASNAGMTRSSYAADLVRKFFKIGSASPEDTYHFEEDEDTENDDFIF